MLTMKMIFLTDVRRKGKNYFEISYISPHLEQHPVSNPRNSFPDGNPQELKSLSTKKSYTPVHSSIPQENEATLVIM